MLIRIVRMTFEKDNVTHFIEVFNKNKHKIRAFSGCQHLELHRDYNHSHIYATYSLWDNEASLNAYRHSDLFKEVWSKTKILFSDKPVAFSQKSIQTVSQ